MLVILQFVTIVLAGVAMSTAVAHALELPGKMRLTREEYLTVQHIYYPGFTIAGLVGEFGGSILVLVLLLLSPPGSALFWLTAAALAGMGGMQLVYWLFTHPANQYWLRGEKLQNVSSAFFSFDPLRRAGSEDTAPERIWMRLRDRWEYSHVARAALSLVSFLTLIFGLRTTA